MAELIPRIIGTGWAVPKKIRLNDDPIFDSVKKKFPDQNLFKGYKERHVLSEGEDLMSIMVPAAKMALRKAGIKASDVDMLIGTGSISDYIQPNALSQLHQKLKLPARAWSIPVGNDFSNYSSSLLLADSLVRAKRAKNILICIGGNWTRNVDYNTPQSISAGDGAGAAVVSLSDDQSKWFVSDQCTVMNTSYYGTMFTDGLKLTLSKPIDGYQEVYSSHFFQITEDGFKGFNAFGMEEALTCVTQLLDKNKLTGADITFLPHQTSTKLINNWISNLDPKPAQVLSTIEKFANITVATHALEMAWLEQKKSIKKDKLVMLALGPDMHANALLLERN